MQIETALGDGVVKKKHSLPELNGLSIDNITITQDGDLKVIFDLPFKQTTNSYQQELQGVRNGSDIKGDKR